MSRLLIKGGRVVDPLVPVDSPADVLVENGRVAKVLPNIPGGEADLIVDAGGLVVAPGFVDLHAHLREPGQEWKEDIESGAHSAVAGGITSVCCMANTEPVNDNPVVTRYIVERAREVGLCDVFPVGAITRGLNGEELAEIGLMHRAGIVAISDDGKPVADSRLLLNAMRYARSLGIPVFCHGEDLTLSAGGHINEGAVSERLGVPGMPAVAEEIGVMRDIALARVTGVHLHLCHISTAGSLQAVRWAKAGGVKVTCEVTPHHFTLSEQAVENFDTNAKVNPPLRSTEDVLACKRGISDGTVDVIATDHAPHSEDEKAVEFCRAPFGMIGFQTLLPISLELVRNGHLTMLQLIDKLSTTPARIIGKGDIGTLRKGARANIVVFDPDEEYTFKKELIKSKSCNTPFLGQRLKGKVKLTIYNGKIVFKDL